ncbi:MAG: peptidoglycan DD-metalloendopeptidase family protein [Alphaproteobacteria bacterium]|nr:peptidoglycan DD-metalloendopeptidase family protein [Alphaproteobacteria bacterium]
MTDIIENVSYDEKQTLFSSKEIIFRSRGRAKVWTISSQAQIIFWAFFFFISIWSFYSYYIYNRSGKLIHKKDIELVETRDAYVDLMTDFVTLHKNISGMLSSVDGGVNKKKVNNYKQQALVLEDKIKQITNEKEWISDEKITEKTTLSEAILQRDIASSERDELRKQLAVLEDTIKELKNAEMEVLKKVQTIADKEVSKVKSAFNVINVPLKRKGLYFNALANSKKGSKGGLYVPDRKHEVRDKKIDKKISKIFESVDDLEYYREVIKTVPIGKPVWSYWVTSQYGRRSDPFNKKAASHKGVDLASRTGNKIKVKAKGKVIKAGMAGGYGNLVVIDHGNGFQTKYAHLNKIYVKKGDYLEYDDTIGEVGTTGRSTGPHLHYEVIYMGKDVDPMPFIKAKIS